MIHAAEFSWEIYYPGLNPQLEPVIAMIRSAPARLPNLRKISVVLRLDMTYDHWVLPLDGNPRYETWKADLFRTVAETMHALPLLAECTVSMPLPPYPSRRRARSRGRERTSAEQAVPEAFVVANSRIRYDERYAVPTSVGPLLNPREVAPQDIATQSDRWFLAIEGTYDLNFNPCYGRCGLLKEHNVLCGSLADQPLPDHLALPVWKFRYPTKFYRL